MSVVDNAKPRPFGRHAWLRLIAWALFGGVVGALFAEWVPVDRMAATPSQVIALVVAVIYLLPGIMVLAGGTIPAVGLAMRMFEDREAWADERGMMLHSGLGCIFLSLVPLVLLAADPLGSLGAQQAAIIALVLFALGCLASWRTLRLMDELWRKVTSEATVIGFYMIFVPGAVWSALAHLGLVAPLAPLDWISLFLAASLAASVIATARRGMIESRL